MTERKHPPMSDLGNGLALEAIREMNGVLLSVSSGLSIDHPETIINFARFACVLESAYNKGVNSITRPMGETEFAQHALGKQAADVLVMKASLLKTENEKLKQSLADMSLIIEGQRPVARLQISEKQLPEDDRVFFDIVVLDRERCADDMELFAAPLVMGDLTTKIMLDAKRWNELLRHAGADSRDGCMHGEFKIRRTYDEYTSHNLMQGAVSQHLTDYIDRMIEARKGK